MAACKRSNSFDEDPEKDDEDECDEDGTRSEFEQFKKWLDEQTPSTSDSRPSANVALENPARCQSCGCSPCK